MLRRSQVPVRFTKYFRTYTAEEKGWPLEAGPHRRKHTQRFCRSTLSTLDGAASVATCCSALDASRAATPTTQRSSRPVYRPKSVTCRRSALHLTLLQSSLYSYLLQRSSSFLNVFSSLNDVLTNATRSNTRCRCTVEDTSRIHLFRWRKYVATSVCRSADLSQICNPRV